MASAAFVVSPTAFFQTNVRAAELLATLVLDAVPGETRVVDLYAGVGLFAVALAARGAHVTAVEGESFAAEDLADSPGDDDGTELLSDELSKASPVARGQVVVVGVTGQPRGRVGGHAIAEQDEHVARDCEEIGQEE